MSPTIVGQAGLLIIGLAACWLDIRYRKLPNWLCAIAALSGLVLANIEGASALMVGSHALHMIAALVVGMALFGLGIIGGGDAKFYAGVAAWFALGAGVRLLMCVSLTGLALFVAWFIWRRVTGKPVRRKAADDSDKFPYGAAIAVGAWVAYMSFV